MTAMHLVRRLLVGALAGLLPVAIAYGDITVTTNGSGTATYPGVSVGGGPYPWSDFGLSASISATPAPLTATVGGSTSYSFLTNLSAANFNSGSTDLQLGYTPGAWSGSLTTGATGGVDASFNYNVGPIVGSDPILNANPGVSLSGNLGPALGSGGTGQVGGSAAAPLGSLSQTWAAQACVPILGCATVASISVGIDVGAQVGQQVSWTPTVTYGDLVWYSQTQTYSTADNPEFVQGNSGTVDNLLGNVSTPNFSVLSGVYYLNFLPVVMLSMPISNEVDTSVPVDLDINGEILGTNYQWLFPLGTLFDLPTGTQTIDFDATWYGPQFYSIPLETVSSCPSLACAFIFYFTSIPQGDGLGTGDGGIPDPVFGSFNGGSWPDGMIGGPGTSGQGPLFPYGTCLTRPCSSDNPPISSVSFDGVITTVPEPGSLVLLMASLLGFAAVRPRMRRLVQARRP